MVTTVAGEQRKRGLTLLPGRFDALMKHAGWTMEQAANLVGVRERTAHRWKTGESAIPKAAWMILCDAAHVQMLENDWRLPHAS